MGYQWPKLIKMDYILETEDKEIKGIEISDEVKEKAMGSNVVDLSLA